jgi:hypothetical protein
LLKIEILFIFQRFESVKMLEDYLDCRYVFWMVIILFSLGFIAFLVISIYYTVQYGVFTGWWAGVSGIDISHDS